MPINIPDGLPAISALESENIFVMSESRAQSQDIRPMKIAVLNLMPTKIETEIQFMRLLSNTPLQIDVTLVVPSTHESKNTSKDYLTRFYKGFSEIEGENFDGMIVTGAPLENKDFEQVDYWDEMRRIMDWTKDHVTTTVYVCWAALAGLNYLYGVGKVMFPSKKSGIFQYRNLMHSDPLMRGLDDIIRMPQSRYATVDQDDLAKNPHLHVAAVDNEGDPGIVISDGGEIFITGHLEYDVNTLAYEYQRDTDRGLDPNVPTSYFPEDDPRFDPVLTWRSHATLIFSNWLNYYVYQLTPYDLKDVRKRRRAICHCLRLNVQHWTLDDTMVPLFHSFISIGFSSFTYSR